MRSLSEIEDALRADADDALVQIQTRCLELRGDLEAWTRFGLAVAEALARVGVGEDPVWTLLNRIGPKSPFEEEWRTARFRILRELALWEGSSKEELGISAVLHVSNALIDAGVDRKSANLFALRQSKSVGIKLRFDPVRLSASSSALLASLCKEDGRG